MPTRSASSQSNRCFEIPEFKSARPPFSRDVNDVEAWMLDQLDIQRQQNQWIMQQLLAGNETFDKIDAEGAEIKKNVQSLLEWKMLIGSSKTIVFGIFSVLLIPVSLILLTEWVKSRLHH